MSNLVSKNQSTYINNRILSDGRRLILNILEITDSLQIDKLLMTIDIEKLFDSVNHFFLISVLKHYLKNQKLCVVNGGKTTCFFKLERCT